MSKAHRGKGIRELAYHGRGECPVCKRNNVKVLYEVEAGEAKLKICKTCKAAVAHGKKALPAAPKKAEAPAEAAPAAEASAPAAEAAPAAGAAPAEATA